MRCVDAKLEVEVVYARADRQIVIPLRLPPKSTLVEAIRASGIEVMFPEIDLARNRVGVFGELAHLGRKLEQGDRVEIYRPLPMDPRQGRRARAASG